MDVGLCPPFEPVVFVPELPVHIVKCSVGQFVGLHVEVAWHLPEAGLDPDISEVIAETVDLPVELVVGDR